MTTKNTRHLRVAGAGRSPEELQELLATVGNDVALMNQIADLWDRLSNPTDIAAALKSLTPEEVEAAIELNRRALGGTPR
jgi:hypothetical protein